MSGPEPTVSVVVCTRNRCESLSLLLDSLRRQEYDHFEVVVVDGPCTDATDEVLSAWEGRIVRRHVDARNLSVSRNVGIAASSGDLVAFIDDDAYPDERWLRNVVTAFEDDEVAAAGGPVRDHTGYTLQALRSMADRWGDVSVELTPADRSMWLHPMTWTFPYTIGTNAVFRRHQLARIGGFDERFAFYLDETDVCLRLIDRGWKVATLDSGTVYHKFLPSSIRNSDRVTTDFSSVILSRAYFSARHGLPATGLGHWAEAYAGFITGIRSGLTTHVRAGRASEEDLEKLESDIDSCTEEGLRLGLEEDPKTRDPAFFATESRELLSFPLLRPPSRKLRIALITQDYPPGPVAGIGRLYHTLAIGLARLGHSVHVLTTATSHSTVDLEDGVWVHRLTATPHPVPRDLPDLPLIWNHSATVLDELARIDVETPIDVVQVPNWDSEGIATIRSRKWPVLLALHTPMVAIAAVDDRFPLASREVQDLIAYEVACCRQASGVAAAYPSTFEYLADEYQMTFDADRQWFLPHGVEDEPDCAEPPAGSNGPFVVLFVGRLEARKGVDTLLEAAVQLLDRGRDVTFQLAGIGSEAGSGNAFREQFESRYPGWAGSRVVFSGELSPEELRLAYRRASVVAVPSRFESFGLVAVEAMRAAKPVVATRVNGLESVVTDGVDGLLVAPGDVPALAAAIEQLHDDVELRRTMAANARRSFENRYRDDMMVEAAVRIYEELLARVDRAGDGHGGTPPWSGAN